VFSDLLVHRFAPQEITKQQKFAVKENFKKSIELVIGQ
jgi:hypothetical protein